MNDLSSVERQFAYDRVRLDNQARGIGVDYLKDSHFTLTPELTQEYGDCKSIPFIPLSVDQGSGTVSTMELREAKLKQCMKAVDLEPENVRSWIQYIAVYEEAAEEAESKKERVRNDYGDDDE